MGEMIEFPATGGTCPGYLAEAADPGAPGVVVIQEFWGLNYNIRSIADRFAQAGYNALAPDLYHGAVATEPDEARKHAMALQTSDAARDMRGAIRYLRERTGGPVGIVGFCMGGALSLYAACDNPDNVAACVTFYGYRRDMPYDFDALRAPVLGLFGEEDRGINPEVVRELDQRLTERGKPHEFTIYPGAGHAFFNDDRPEAYRPEAARDAWEKVLAFYCEHLGSPAARRS